jgi:hypothetical protein
MKRTFLTDENIYKTSYLNLQKSFFYIRPLRIALKNPEGTSPSGHK